MDRSKFDTNYSEIVLDSIEKLNPSKQYSGVYRVAKVECGCQPNPPDFYPSFIKHCNCSFPPKKTQEHMLNKPLNNGIFFFGTSFFTDLEKCKQSGVFIPTERNNSIVVGSTSKEFGLCSDADDNAHFVYFLYDPLNANICKDFHPLTKKRKINE